MTRYEALRRSNKTFCWRIKVLCIVVPLFSVCSSGLNATTIFFVSFFFFLTVTQSNSLTVIDLKVCTCSQWSIAEVVNLYRLHVSTPALAPNSKMHIFQWRCKVVEQESNGTFVQFNIYTHWRQHSRVLSTLAPEEHYSTEGARDLSNLLLRSQTYVSLSSSICCL